MKKLISVFLAAVLVLSVFAVAMAENKTSGGVLKDADDTVKLYVIWEDKFTVSTEAKDPQNLPEAILTYTIEPGSAADATETSPQVKAGVGNPQITWTNHAATDAGDTEDTRDVKADFSNVTFTEPGIYRYNVTVDLDSSCLADIDIDVNNDANAGNYVLDVYVQRVKTEGNPDTFKPYAYALSKTGAFQEFNTTTMEAIYAGTNPKGKVDVVTHELTTYDLTIKKVITGTASANEFDFTIDIKVPSDVIVKQDETANSVAGNQTFTATLKNNETTVIKGLPSTAIYEIVEEVNKLEGYTVAVTVNGNTAGEADYFWKDNNNFGSVKDDVAMGKDNNTIIFTNNLDNISPTGVVLRIAPYALILIAGVALLLISRRRTEKE